MERTKEQLQEDKAYYERSRIARNGMHDEIAQRFYVWDWCMSYGWRQMGSSEGYATLKEARASEFFNFDHSTNWKIFKAEVVLEKEYKPEDRVRTIAEDMGWAEESGCIYQHDHKAQPEECVSHN